MTRMTPVAVRTARLTLLGLLLAVLPGVARAQAPAPPVEPPPIAIVVLDALRPDRLGAYGFTTRETSPTFDALAAESVLFERAYAPAPYTAASVGSLLTGLAPESHTLTHLDRRLPEELRTLPAELREAGYTSLVASRSGILNGFGLQDEFDRTVVDPELAGDIRRFRRRWKREATEIAARPGAWFVYLHLFPPHAPYEPPSGFPLPFPVPQVEGVSGSIRFLNRLDRGEATLAPEAREALLARYDAHLRYGDHQLADAVRYLATLGVLERGYLIVTSDHGEAFGEHGRFEHNSTVFEEMIRIPLLVRPPGGIEGGRRVETPVSLLDVLPSARAWAGLPARPELAGVALDLEGGETAPERTRPITARSTGAHPHFSVLRDGLKLIVPLDGAGAAELYDLRRDPHERQNLAAARPREVLRLRAIAAAELARQRTEAASPRSLEALDPAVEQGLRALGYIE